MKKRILIGTNNPSKLSQISSFFDPEQFECVSPAMLGIAAKPTEDQSTAQENALQKALFFHRASGLPVLTEDSGLLYLDLPADHPDQPGVRVRRPRNHQPLDDDEDMIAYYSAVIARHGGTLRAAWHDAWCFMADESTYSIHTDDIPSLVRHAMTFVATPCQARKPGWPLDSLTVSKVSGKYWAEMSPEYKRTMRQIEFSGFEEDRERMLAWLNTALQTIR